ncbi:MAG: methyltransferase domain-containing protein [Tissierellia bacterium]|nr:methyltransferase domain-containing protein [Tissierellia bacterium]
MKYRLTKQIVQTFIISWIFFWPLAIVTKIDGIDFHSIVAKGLFLLGRSIPSLVAILHFSRNRNVEDKKFRTYLKDIKVWIFGKSAENSIFFLFLGLLILGFGLSSKFQLKIPLAHLPATIFVMIFLWGGNEELFWRGTLLDSFLRIFPLLPSAIAIGLISGLWHLPLYFIPGFERGIPFFPFLISTVIAGIFLAVLKMQGSLFQCMVIHGCLNLGFTTLEIKNFLPILMGQLILLAMALQKSKEIEVLDKGPEKWGKFADIYDRLLERENAAYQEVGKRILKRDPRLKTLELCAGTGMLTRILADHFFDFETSDYSKEMLDQLRKKCQGMDIKYSILDCTKIEKPQKSYDLIIMANALHILEDADSAIKEVERILKRDGLFIVATFLREDTWRQKLQNQLMKWAGVETFHHWTYEHYQKYFLEKDWNIIEKAYIPSRFPIGYLVLEKPSEEKC